MLADAEGTEPLQVRIACPDGDPGAALMLAETFRLMQAPVVATATGMVGGPAVAVYAAAGRRTASAHAQFRLTEPRATFSGPARQLASAAELHRDQRDRLIGLIAGATGRDPARVAADLAAGTLLTAPAAVEYGLVHDVV
jgi:ATP-dependent Clp protease protease subunit